MQPLSLNELLLHRAPGQPRACAVRIAEHPGLAELGAHDHRRSRLEPAFLGVQRDRDPAALGRHLRHLGIPCLPVDATQ